MNFLQKFTLTDFERSIILGEGVSGKVWRVRHIPLKKIFALKMVRKNADVLQEINIQDHSNILSLTAYFKDRSLIHLLLPYCTDDMLKFMRRKKLLTERRVAKYVHQVIAALKYMHEKSIMHTDVKPENLLINEAGFILLANFGNSTFYETSNICVGTPRYMAPDVWAEQTYNNKVDSWSVGVLTTNYY